MNLQVDQKVVCINDRFPIQVLEWGSNLPKLGSVYTISDIEIVDAYQGPRGPALLLAELKNPGDRLWSTPGDSSLWNFHPNNRSRRTP